MKFISVVTACYNEEDNVEELYREVKRVIEGLKIYTYEHIFIDNASSDNTISILKEIARKDKNLKIIVNAKNFGHIRSPHYGLCQASGEAVIGIAADMQDPPVLIKDFLRKWEDGYKIVIGVKTQSEENLFIFALRKCYYNLLQFFSETEHIIKNFSGYGLYDRKFIDVLKQLNEPYPFFRGLVSELGYDIAEVEFVQPKRKKGKSKNNFYTLYDMAMLGFINYSRIPLRMAVFVGFSLAFFNLLVAMVYFIYKIIFWENFQLGMAPLVIGLFFFSAVQLFFIGIVGEYVGTIYLYTKNRPLVIEKERINF